MNEIIIKMLEKYACHSVNDYENALKEIIQEIALLGLWRGKFFEKAAFYGGTALRILYGLDRFSQDLDFSLLKTEPGFNFSTYLPFIAQELKGFDFDVTVQEKIKTDMNPILSAFIKSSTKTLFLKINTPDSFYRMTHTMETLKIKVEIDTNPPEAFQTESKLLLQPIPFYVNTYQRPDLFAGKCHALLCRKWKNRVKGRDWYDLVWYISHNIPCRLLHLQKRLEQTGHWSEDHSLTLSDLQRLLQERILHINFNKAKEDVIAFLKNPQAIEMWSTDFFEQVIKKISAC